MSDLSPECAHGQTLAKCVMTAPTMGERNGLFKEVKLNPWPPGSRATTRIILSSGRIVNEALTNWWG